MDEQPQFAIGSLYLELAEPAPPGAPGRTPETRQKETVDNDVESLLLEALTVASCC